MCVFFFLFFVCFVVVICGLVHGVHTVFLLPKTTNSNIFDLHVQCRIVLKFIFRVFV